jgi:hypothetical protein
MRLVCQITKARIHTNTHTHSEYVITTAFPSQPCLRESASILRYTHTSCLVKSCARRKLTFGDRIQFQLRSWRHICLDALAPWSSVFPEKLTVLKSVEKFPACYGTRSSIVVLKQAPLVTKLSQINPVHAFRFYRNYDLFLYCHLCLGQKQYLMCIFLLPMHATYLTYHTSLSYHPNYIWRDQNL